MKINNETKWQTKQVSALIRRVAQDEFDPDRMKKLKVRVCYTRRQGSTYSSGYAYLNSNYLCIRVSPAKIDKIDMAHVIAHEMGHCRGLKHGAAMNSSRYRRIGNWRERYAYALDFPVEETPTKKKAPRVTGDKADTQKMEKATAKVLEWDRKIKTANTRRKTWQKKVKYYENKLKKAANRGVK